MAEEISLSLEETNALRIKLGLKPIPKTEDNKQSIQPSEYVHKSPETQFQVKNNNSGSKKYRFVDERLLNKLRNRIASVSHNPKSSTSTNDDWLTNINKGNTKSEVKLPKVQINYDVDEVQDDLPIVQVANNLEELKSGQSITLTLKESSITEEDDIDTLQVDHKHDEEQNATNLKQRHDKKKPLRSITALEEQGTDIDKPGKLISVGALNRIDNDTENDINKESISIDTSNKVKVTFDSDDDQTESSDFKRPRIKKRKRKQDTTLSRKRMNRDHEVELSNIDFTLDTHINMEELDEDITITPVVKPAVMKSADEIAEEIRRAKIERERREEEIRRLQGQNERTLTISETADFFDTLKDNILTEPETSELPSHTDETSQVKEEEHIVQENGTSPSEEIATSEVHTAEPAREEDKPDFYNGLASTLSFLNSHNVLPKERNSKSTGTKRKDSTRLEYRDDEGNLLTTKEAYKQLSQKFHGTKSNKQKAAKAKAKIRARNNDTSTDYTDFHV